MGNFRFLWPIAIALIASSALASSPRPVITLDPILLPQRSRPKLKTLDTFRHSKLQFSSRTDSPAIFDIPMTYNARVKYWIRFFQTTGRKWFQTWLERSPRYMPLIQDELHAAGLPQDLAYIAMIESGLSSSARSNASAVGPWQFMESTAHHYGLHVDWWLDERRDFNKSTAAAVQYLKDLYSIFQSWYLVAASYNTGENRIKRVIERYHTNDFWTLARAGAFKDETINYVPKLLAATLIAKAPALYGFRDIQPQLPLRYDYFYVPGGTDLFNLADYLRVARRHLQELNPELVKGFVPNYVESRRIRIPKGSMPMVSQFVRRQLSARN